ncbi:hypothetical protein [Cesiribacter andamanensis]|uniref:DnaJ domain protein n=1 Tax=Cesiribacter andamanensis AMV16 TaxID=1279009 RepID=M7N2P7_9BACT|nr:hypothetical protein [Cesiribacter andamanensis]EMR01572.1 hypothetical protein ADICEAN_03309 [Cesiribacter andamanensis AMV16]
MPHLPQLPDSVPADDLLGLLQQEIREMETELESIKQELAPFEAQIHARLDGHMDRIQQLADLYKQQKREKKARRLEQKKRGKNWQEPTQLRTVQPSTEAPPAQADAIQRELRRLYKEAVVQVHPDKFVHAGEQERIQRATAITAQLNALYKRGDLEELIHFYHAIMGSTAVAEKGRGAAGLSVDPQLRLEALKRKKEEVRQRLEQIRGSYLYTVLKTYENPLLFIDELQQQFEERIQQLEKRTRINKRK